MSDKILRHGHPSDTAANWKANNPVIGKVNLQSNQIQVNLKLVMELIIIMI